MNNHTIWKKSRKKCKYNFKRSRYDSRLHVGRKVDGCKFIGLSCKSITCPNYPHGYQMVASPNPKYEQAARIAEQFVLQWVSVVEHFGQYERVFVVRNHGKVHQYKIQFTEDMLEFSKIPEYMVGCELDKAVHELAKRSRFSESELRSRWASGLVG